MADYARVKNFSCFGFAQDLLKHMVAQKVKPNLQTFNAVLKGLRKFYLLGRLPALQTLREMKYIGIGKGTSWVLTEDEMSWPLVSTIKAESVFTFTITFLLGFPYDYVISCAVAPFCLGIQLQIKMSDKIIVNIYVLVFEYS